MRLFHVSEEPGIDIFEPRPSPQRYQEVTGDVVFAISEEMLHLYLTPRDCPRVCYMAGPGTSEADRQRFLDQATVVMALEPAWRLAMRDTRLFRYEFSPEGFELLDANAGYYISYKPVTPIGLVQIAKPIEALPACGVQLVYVADLWQLADEVSHSTLRFSCIRMSNVGSHNTPF